MKNKEKKINNISISSHISILGALKKMDDTYKRLLLVFENEKFINVVSIGDIQRAIIQNQSMNTNIVKILRNDTRLSNEHESFVDIKEKMLKYRAECMPVLYDNGNLKDVYFWEDVFPPEEKRIKRELNLPVVIMAGGRGTRLKPITNVLPKALVPYGEKTILENIMDKFIDVGCNDFYLSVNYKAEMIRHYLKSLELSKYDISFFEEDKPLGTAGSLYLLKDKIDQPFFISNCDILIDEDYGEIYSYHKENNNDLTIVAALKHYPIQYGTIESGDNGMLEKLIEKPEVTFKINSGMYLLEPHLLKDVPENTFFHITELIEKIKKKGGNIGVFPVSERSWTDLGTWEEYLLNAKTQND